MHSEFDNIINKLGQGQLWDFPGGVHPPERKNLSNQHEIATIPLPSHLYVQVKQHIGVEGHLIVKEGDQVLKGQPLSKSMNPFAVPIHAPTSGTITRIGAHVSAHPSALPEQCIEIEPDELENWVELTAMPDYQDKPKSKVIEAICDAGISGMGGAGFPTHIKVSPKKNLEFLIINGVECEPYITSDDRLMREHAWQIRQGIDVLTHLLSPKQVIIAIEDNKPQAIEAMRVACRENPKYMVCTIPTKYPAGGEKQLIQVLTNREVPKQGLPIDVGVIMQNVGTCYAIADAIFSGKPLIHRVVTLTGEALDKPKNVWALIGTPVSHLLAMSAYHKKRQKTPRYIMGGPMMGFEIASPLVPVVKTTNCILVPSEQALPRADAEQACIRCSACADACPVSLLPQQLFWHSKGKELDKADEYNLFDCIECGACAYVCPSEIPLVHYYRIAKAEIRQQQEEKEKADKARERFESRQARLLQEQQARDEKHQKAAEARRLAMQQSGDSSKDKIAAALARAKAKKQLSEEQNSNQTEQASSQTDATDNKATETPQQDKIAAAIARAKAKRQQAQQNDEAADSAIKDSATKQDKIAMAIARAKARRDQAIQDSNQTADKPQADIALSAPEKPQQATGVAEEKKQRIAAAVAKAKAKKADSSTTESDTEQVAQTPQSEASDESDKATETVEQDDKKQRIARAVARAKAKKQAEADSQILDGENNEKKPE